MSELLDKATAQLHDYREKHGREPECCYLHPFTWDRFAMEMREESVPMEPDDKWYGRRTLLGFPVNTSPTMLRDEVFFGLGPAT